MEYKSVQEIAEAWGVSNRRVQRLCSEGRIEGAKKLGRVWMIPHSAPKSEDIRLGLLPIDLQQTDILHEADDSLGVSSISELDTLSLEETQIGSNSESLSNKPTSKHVDFEPSGSELSSKLMPLMNTPFVPGESRQVVENITDPSMRFVAQAEYQYFSGEAQKAAEGARELLTHPDSAVRLSACLIYAYANLTIGQIGQSRMALHEIHRALQADSAISAAHSKALSAFVAYTAATLLHLPVPETVPPMRNFLSLLPLGLKTFTLYVHAHRLYLEGEYARSIGVVEAALMANPTTYPIPEIYLHLAATMDYMALRKSQQAREHLLAAWEIAQPDGFIEAFGEHHGLLGGLLESTLKQNWPEEFKRIIDLAYRFSDGWIAVHNPATGDMVADNLSTTEFVVAMLAARDWSNKEIGAHLGISTNTVKGHLASVFQKLGISSRKDLTQFLLK